jgi:hypothetical protein
MLCQVGSEQSCRPVLGLHNESAKARVHATMGACPHFPGMTPRRQTDMTVQPEVVRKDSNCCDGCPAAHRDGSGIGHSHVSALVGQAGPKRGRPRLRGEPAWTSREGHPRRRGGRGGAWGERGRTSREGNRGRGGGRHWPRGGRGWTSREGHPGRKVKRRGDRLSPAAIECCNVSFLARPRRRVVLVW